MKKRSNGAWHNAIFTALPCKHNGQAAINSTMEAKHSSCIQYIFTSKTNKGKAPNVSLISCILLENAVYAAALVSVSSNFGCQTKPCHSLKKISVTTFINWFISAYDSTAQNLAARIPQKWPLLDQKMRILWHNANSQELLNPENDWLWRCSTTYPKAKKAIYHHETTRYRKFQRMKS